MRSRLAPLGVLAAAALACSPEAPASLRAASVSAPREVVCGEVDCSWLLAGGACQHLATWLSLPGQFTDVRVSAPAVGATSLVTGGATFVVDLQPDAATFDWSATTPVAFVAATAVQDSNVYVYAPPATAGQGLVAWSGRPLTQVLFCLPASAPPAAGCTLTQGYWKTHGEEGPAPYDPRWRNLGALGGETPFFLSGQTWLELFRTPVQGSAYVALAHQYMAARLNVLAGASPDALGDALDLAGAFFAANGPEAALAPDRRSELVALAGLLDRFNRGELGPGHCDDAEDGAP